MVGEEKQAAAASSWWAQGDSTSGTEGQGQLRFVCFSSSCLTPCRGWASSPTLQASLLTRKVSHTPVNTEPASQSRLAQTLLPCNRTFQTNTELNQIIVILFFDRSVQHEREAFQPNWKLSKHIVMSRREKWRSKTRTKMAFEVLYVSELLQKEKARTMRSNLNSGKNRRNSSCMKKVGWYQWGHKLRCQKTCGKDSQVLDAFEIKSKFSMKRGSLGFCVIQKIPKWPLGLRII